MSRLDVSESQIEDALSGHLDLLAKYLGVDKNINIVARQLPLRGGEHRLDLLLSCGKNLLLVELKAGYYAEKHVQQVENYRAILREMQEKEELLEGGIESFLFVVGATGEHKKAAAKRGVKVVVYNPEEIMLEYFRRMSSLSSFLRIKPKDYGAYSIGRITGVLRQLSGGVLRTEKIAEQLGISRHTADHLLRGAEDFGLARRKNKNWFLTDMGELFVSSGEPHAPKALSEKQIEIIKSFVAKNPFYSPTIFGVYAVIECAFLLARNSYPVAVAELNRNFRMISGKNNEWLDHVIDRRARAFLRFAVELELLGRIGDKIIITPAGFRFIIMLQLRKGIEMIEGLSLADGA